MDSSQTPRPEPDPEPKPQPAPQAAPQARPQAAANSLGPRLADSYTALPQAPMRSRAALWAGLAALLALGLLTARSVSHHAAAGAAPAQIEAYQK